MTAISSPGLATPSRRAITAQSASRSRSSAHCSWSAQRTPNRRLSRRTVSGARRDREDRDLGPERGDDPRGAAALGRDDDRREAEPVGRADGALGDRGRDVALADLDPVEEPVAVGEVLLGRARDPVHRRDRLDRVVADRRLLGEHDRVGAVVDRVGDVGDLGPRRPVAGHHRGEHLGRRDHRLRLLAGEPDQPLLGRRHVLDRQLDAEVAARDHDPAGRRGDDLLGLLGGLRLLDLRDQRDVGVALGEPLVRPARGRRPSARTRRRAGRPRGRPRSRPSPCRRRRPPASPRCCPGRLTPWWEATRPPASTMQRISSPSTSSGPQPDAAVGEVDRVALVDGVGEPVPADRQQLARADRRVVGGQGQLAAGLDLDEAALDLVEPQLRTGEVAEDRRPTCPSARRRRGSARRSRRGSASSPWEKLSRKTSAPAEIRRSSIFGDREAGPIVATILVRR